MNAVKTTVLLAGLTGLLLAMGWATGGERGMTYALVLAGLVNFVSFFFSDKIVLAMYGAQPVSREQSPALYEIVERLAMKAGIPVPRVYVIPSPSLNAFATGRSPEHAAVAATAGLLEALDREELEGVLAHELSHVLNRDTLISTVAATIAGAITMVARMAFFMGGSRDDRNRDNAPNPLVSLLLLILTPIAAMLIQLAISRSREYGADATGARLVGYPQGLISALRKLQVAAERVPMNAAPQTAHLFIVNPLSGRSLLSLFNTHPPLEKRIERLMQVQGS
jgi:heat shock protein HtpX